MRLWMLIGMGLLALFPGCAHREPEPFSTRVQRLNSQLTAGRITPQQYYGAVQRASREERARIAREARRSGGRPVSGSLVPLDAFTSTSEADQLQFRRDIAMRAALQANEGRGVNFLPRDTAPDPAARLRVPPPPAARAVDPEHPLPDGVLGDGL
jgi:hypothetical protein